MLTPEEKDRVKRLLLKKTPVIRIAFNTGHSPTTVRKVRAEWRKELNQPPTSLTANHIEDFSFIPLEVGFLSELMLEQAIDPSSQVLVPVSTEIAQEYFKIEKAFQGLEPLLEEMAKTISDAIDIERAEEVGDNNGRDGENGRL